MDASGIGGKNYGEGAILKNMGAAPRLNSRGEESLQRPLCAAAKNGPDKEILRHIKSYLGRFEGSSLNTPQQVAEAKHQVLELRKQSWF
jgi:hypothetical protein